MTKSIKTDDGLINNFWIKLQDMFKDMKKFAFIV